MLFYIPFYAIRKVYSMKILFLGDIVSLAGRNAAAHYVYEIREKENIDLCIANCENSAGGFGVTKSVLEELSRCGIDAFTTGNHVYSKKEAIELLSNNEFDMVRPYNLSKKDPGRGVMLLTARGGETVAVINLLGRLFIDMPISNPFDAAESALSEINGKAKHIIVDFHAEATSEKRAMGYFLDGRVSAVLGTHTHVQTADAQILPNGTAYITDAGMCGAFNSVLGAKPDVAVSRFVSSVGKKYEAGEGEEQFCAVVLTLSGSGKAEKIERIFKTNTNNF